MNDQRKQQTQQNEMNYRNFQSNKGLSKKNNGGGWEKPIILSLSLLYIFMNYKKAKS
ncbi:hypothetical protein [Domibacillus epiphyticus]|uniref:hypothetical protein n=1 Tax=Domibacillus epiphyticus TaxID=1714355 RepID=UPI0013015D4D|nr:hypothetical protein [Domibacillus epiphyticus]